MNMSAKILLVIFGLTSQFLSGEARFCYACSARIAMNTACQLNATSATVAVTDCAETSHTECIVYVANNTVTRTCGHANQCMSFINTPGFVMCSGCTLDLCNNAPITDIDIIDGSSSAPSLGIPAILKYQFIVVAFIVFKYIL